MLRRSNDWGIVSSCLVDFVGEESWRECNVGVREGAKAGGEGRGDLIEDVP